MTAETRIELARADDLPRLQAVERAAGRLFAGTGVTLVDFDAVTSLEELAEAQTAGLLWVARVGDAPVGFALVCLADGDPHLEEIDVDPEHGRRGIGRALLAATFAWARAAGHRHMTLSTFREIRWNAPFYASVGFREISGGAIGPELAAIVNDETARGLDPAQRVVMRLDLAPPREPR